MTECKGLVAGHAPTAFDRSGAPAEPSLDVIGRNLLEIRLSAISAIRANGLGRRPPSQYLPPHQILDHLVRERAGVSAAGQQVQLGIFRYFIRLIDAGEILDLA